VTKNDDIDAIIGIFFYLTLLITAVLCQDSRAFGWNAIILSPAKANYATLLAQRGHYIDKLIRPMEVPEI